MSDTEVSFVCEELRACRVCLATDVQLVALRHGRLDDTYTELTGIPVLATDGLPQHLCSICAALLQKSDAFRNKCRNTHAFLLQTYEQLQPFGRPLHKVQITTSLICNLDKGFVRLPYITTKTITISLPGDISDGNYVESEIPVKQETQTNFEIKEKFDSVLDISIEELYDSMLGEEPIEQSNDIKEEIFADVNIIKTEDPISVNDTPVPKKRKHFKVSPVTKSKKREKIKEYLIKSEEQTDNDYKKLFYNHVLNKYFYKTKEMSCMDDLDVFVSGAKEGTVDTVDDSIDKSTVNVNYNLTQCGNQIFYNYIQNKYVNKKEAGKERKIVDVTRLKVRTIKYNRTFKPKEELDDFAKTYNFDIIKMSKSEQILHLQQARTKTLQYKKSIFTCKYCFRGFKTETVFDSHMAVHDPSSGSHVCDVCKYRFPTSRKLNKHILEHKTKFVCRQCKQSFKSCTVAREHYKSHAGVTYQCEHCDLTFSKYASRINHIRIHHGATQCDICYEGFQGPKGVVQHKTKAHKQTYQCASCDVHFDNARAMLRHIGSSPDGACDPSVRACAKCGERFDTGERFDEHVARLHAKSREKPQKRNEEHIRRDRRCCTCEYNVPTGEKCPCSDGGHLCVCPMGSTRSCRLTHGPHKGCCKRRRRNTQVMCEMCANIFQTETALRLHQRVHTGEKPYQCEECPSRFRLKMLLEMHIRTHTGDRPFKCQLCSKAFKTRGANYRHQLVHTKERRYRCEVCDKMFQTSTCVKLHVRTVHMKIPQPPRVRTRKRKCE